MTTTSDNIIDMGNATKVRITIEEMYCLFAICDKYEKKNDMKNKKKNDTPTIETRVMEMNVIKEKLFSLWDSNDTTFEDFCVNEFAECINMIYLNFMRDINKYEYAEQEIIDNIVYKIDNINVQSFITNKPEEHRVCIHLFDTIKDIYRECKRQTEFMANKVEIYKLKNSEFNIWAKSEAQYRHVETNSYIFNFEWCSSIIELKSNPVKPALPVVSEVESNNAEVDLYDWIDAKVEVSRAAKVEKRPAAQKKGSKGLMVSNKEAVREWDLLYGRTHEHNGLPKVDKKKK